jgi:uncharacterized membrane protein
MFVPVSIIVVIAVAVFLLMFLCAFSIFAWLGIAHQHNALLDRVKVMQIEIYDLKTPLLRVGGRD